MLYCFRTEDFSSNLQGNYTCWPLKQVAAQRDQLYHPLLRSFCCGEHVFTKKRWKDYNPIYSLFTWICLELRVVNHHNCLKNGPGLWNLKFLTKTRNIILLEAHFTSVKSVFHPINKNKNTWWKLCIPHFGVPWSQGFHFLIPLQVWKLGPIKVNPASHL